MHSENARVRLLMVDDEADGFERVGALLQVRGWRVEGERVSTSEAFRRRLAEEDWDVVLSERVLPGWGGRDVLTVVRALSDAPQVVVFSHIPEDAEAEHLLREGAADYVSKANPARLAPAIARSVRDATLRRELRSVRTALREEQAKLLARRALSEGEQRYRGLFHESVAAIAVFDSNKRFVDVNQAGLDLLGYPRDELLRLAMPDVDADPAAVMPAHRELLSGGRLRNYRHRLRRKDGRVITVLNNSRPITAAGGTIVGLLSTLIDVTDLELAQERVRLQGEQLRMALEAADMVTWHLEVATGRLTYSTNLAALSGADGLTPYVTLDRFVLELHPEDREPAKRAID
ncbi:MAG: PAS domain S-box protein, partial [Verrucomicrobiales bacterium]|nr:PAS domain S-box protein [Verrucomicrobiales bacterium]